MLIANVQIVDLILSLQSFINLLRESWNWSGMRRWGEKVLCLVFIYNFTEANFNFCSSIAMAASSECRCAGCWLPSVCFVPEPEKEFLFGSGCGSFCLWVEDFGELVLFCPLAPLPCRHRIGLLILQSLFHFGFLPSSYKQILINFARELFAGEKKKKTLWQK